MVRDRHSLYWEVIISCRWQIWFYDFSNLQWCNGCHARAWGAWMTCRFMSCSGKTWKLVKLILADFPPNVKYKTFSCQDKTWYSQQNKFLTVELFCQWVNLTCIKILFFSFDLVITVLTPISALFH